MPSGNPGPNLKKQTFFLTLEEQKSGSNMEIFFSEQRDCTRENFPNFF
jgi:hypothetical protein